MSDFKLEFSKEINSLKVTYKGAPVIGLDDSDISIFKSGSRQVNSLVNRNYGIYQFDNEIEKGSTIFVNKNNIGDKFYIDESIHI